MRGPKKRLTPFGKMVVKALADRDMTVPFETPTPISWYLVLSIFFRCAALFFHASTAKDGSEESRICHSPIK